MKFYLINFINKNLNICYSNNYSSILEVLEHNKIFIDFQCRSGYCGICRLYLISGSIKYLYDPIGFISYKEILPCCCVPTSNIKIKL